MLLNKDLSIVDVDYLLNFNAVFNFFWHADCL